MHLFPTFVKMFDFLLPLPEPVRFIAQAGSKNNVAAHMVPQKSRHTIFHSRVAAAIETIMKLHYFEPFALQIKPL
jgi:hypothetical protein